MGLLCCDVGLLDGSLFHALRASAGIARAELGVRFVSYCILMEEWRRLLPLSRHEWLA